MTRRELDTFLDPALAPEFIGVRGGLRSSPPINDVCRAVGIGTRVDRATGIQYLEPTIHVRSIPIESVYVGLTKHVKPKPRLDQTSTLSRQLGYLEPENSYHAWAIEPQADPEQIINEMKQAILKYGPVLWDRFSTNDRIFAAVEAGDCLWPGNKPYTLPIVYGLTDRKEEAIALLLKTANSMKHPIYDEFMRNWFAFFTPGTKSPV